MIDADGAVTEATTANLLIYRRDEGLISPPAERILPGISVAATLELAERQSIPVRSRDLFPADLAGADEALLTSTSVCLLPVVRFDRQPIGDSRPGPIFRRLLSAWNELVGLDIAAQAARFADAG